MRIGLYTDTHYSSFDIGGSARRRTLAPERVKAAYDSFIARGCDMAVCLGDLTDGDVSAEKERENLVFLSSVIDSYPIPSVVLMGNHDAFDFTPDEFYYLIGEDKRPHDISDGGRKLIFIDACWFRNGRHYMPGDSDWTDTFYPYAGDIPRLLGDCREAYIFMHQNIDPDLPQNHRLYNADRMISVIRDDGRVKKVFQGHYHPGHVSEHDGIGYVTLPALCENDGAYMITDL